MHRLLLILLLFLGAVSFLRAQLPTNATVNVRAELARSEIVIGDQIYLDINISAPPGTTVLPLDPAIIDALPGLEVIKDEELRTVAQNPELLLEQRLLLTSFDTGYVTIPPLPVYYEDAFGLRDTAYTTDFLLTVRGAVVASEDDILPIKPIIEESRNLLDYWWVFALLALALLALGYREYRRRRTIPAPAAPPPPPAHVRALTALDALEERRLWQTGQTDAYYVELTRILRAYLAERFHIPAPELTTRQITRQLSDRAGLDGAQRDELSELLQLSDLVKFAKATPAEELHPQGLRRVRDFVRETTVEEAVPTETTD
ncbi:hypothetical protein LEM8419_02114 [Neolewinella maritima]|uniref:Protein BatD n=1 Tax=Neolewinella maritima TaxID=1383882 RepID=A0ABN8F7K3_9BACT|nr:hypothetical protein [Neolewinella maritima]CAH1001215.1 hypothetical protein LEM8419_02114 [Neolewinella maritima]